MGIRNFLNWRTKTTDTPEIDLEPSDADMLEAERSLRRELVRNALGPAALGTFGAITGSYATLQYPGNSTLNLSMGAGETLAALSAFVGVTGLLVVNQTIDRIPAHPMSLDVARRGAWAECTALLTMFFAVVGTAVTALHLASGVASLASGAASISLTFALCVLQGILRPVPEQIRMSIAHANGRLRRINDHLQTEPERPAWTVWRRTLTWCLASAVIVALASAVPLGGFSWPATVVTAGAGLLIFAAALGLSVVSTVERTSAGKRDPIHIMRVALATLLYCYLALLVLINGGPTGRSVALLIIWLVVPLSLLGLCRSLSRWRSPFHEHVALSLKARRKQTQRNLESQTERLAAAGSIEG